MLTLLSNEFFVTKTFVTDIINHFHSIMKAIPKQANWGHKNGY